MVDKPDTNLPEPANPTETPSPSPRKPSPAQRVLEHGLSFLIVVPAIGGFLALLAFIIMFIPDLGPKDAVTNAVVISGNFWTIGYIIGAVPSLLTGLLVFPAWQRLGNSWKLYAPLACLNGVLCAAAAFFLLGQLAGLPIIGIAAILATLITFFMTKKFRE